MNLFASDGVGEFEELGVQEVAPIAGEAGEVLERLAGWAVEGIAHERMADGGEMDSDLMRASRMESYLKGRGVCRAGDYFRR